MTSSPAELKRYRETKKKQAEVEADIKRRLGQE
jgi:hypothetical protein